MSKDEILKAAQEKIKTFFSGLVTPEEKEALKNWVKLADTPAVPPGTPAPGAPTEVNTKDGKKLSIEGELKVNAVIKESTPDGLKDLPDGPYVLVDDKGAELPITVMGGKIAEISTPAEEAQDKKEGEMAKQIATLSTQLSEQKTAYEKETVAYKAELADVKKQVVVLTKHITKILETPVNFSTPKTEKKVSEMNNYELMKHNRGEKIFHS